MPKDEKDKLPPHLRNVPDKFNYLKDAYKPELDPNTPIELGTMNGWGNKDNYPASYTTCQGKERHLLTCEEIAHNYFRYTCPLCKITFTADTSD
jgi:hypothetical protein